MTQNENSLRNLRSLGDIPVDEARRIQSMGGRTMSRQRLFSLKLTALKKMKDKSPAVDRLIETLEDRSSSLAEMKIYIQKLEELDLTVDQRMKLANLKLTWHKACHGSPDSGVNINVQQNLIPEFEKEDILSKLRKVKHVNVEEDKNEFEKS